MKQLHILFYISLNVILMTTIFLTGILYNEVSATTKKSTDDTSEEPVEGGDSCYDRGYTHGINNIPGKKDVYDECGKEYLNGYARGCIKVHINEEGGKKLVTEEEIKICYNRMGTVY